MATVLREVDRDALGTILFDFNDETGANNPSGLRTYLLGDMDDGEAVAPAEVSNFQRLQRIPKPRQIRFRVRSFHPTSTDTYMAAAAEMYHRLETLAKDGGVFFRQLHGATEGRYLSVLTVSAPSLLRGQELALYEITRLLDDVKGLPITLVVEPYTWGLLLDSNTNKAPQDTGLVDSNDDGTPDSLSFDATTNVTGQSVQPTTESFQFIVNTTTERLLRQTYNAVASITGQDWVISFEAKVSGTARVRARIEFLDSGGVVVGAATDSAAFVTPTAFPDSDVPTNRVWVIANAPASAQQVRLTVRCSNSAAGNGTYDVRRFQIEQGTTPTRFICSSKTVSNDPAVAYGRFVPRYIHGDAETAVEETLTPLSGSPTPKVEEVVLAYRGSGGRDGGNSVADLLNRASLVQFSGTSDTDHSGGARGNASRKTLTDNLEALRGAWLALARLQSVASTEKLKLWWGPSLLDPEPEVTEELTGLVATREFDVALGRVVVPEDGDLAGIALRPEGSATDSASLDYFLLVPTDRLSSVHVPAVAANTVLGKDLGNKDAGNSRLPVTTAGTADGNDIILDANDEVGAKTFGILPAGRYRVTYRYSVRNRGSGYTMKWTVENLDTDLAVTEVTHSGSGNPESNVTVTVDFDADGTTSYEAVAWLDAIGTNNAVVTVHEMTREFVPYVGAGESLRTDPEFGPFREPRVYKLNSSGQVLLEGRVGAGGVPLQAEPGLGACYQAMYDVRAGNQDTELESILGRTWTSRHRYYPKYLV